MNPEEFLQKNFLKLALIHETEITKIYLVKKISSDKKFVLRIIERKNLPYLLMTNLEQKTLPKIFYAAETDSKTFVIEEFLQGMNLLEYIKIHGEFSEEVVMKFAEELCDCLEILHARKILHRDLKPSNLFLTDDGILKLIDFDAGRVEKVSQENDTQIIGTPGFAPPEQYGFRQTDERSDIYALGLTLKMLLGFEKYHGNFLGILKKCTEFDPARRYKNISELKSAIMFRKKYLHWKKFLIVSAVAGIFIAILFLNINSAETPNFEISEQKIWQEEGSTPVEEKFSKQIEETIQLQENVQPSIEKIPQDKIKPVEQPQIIYQPEKNSANKIQQFIDD